MKARDLQGVLSPRPGSNWIPFDKGPSYKVFTYMALIGMPELKPFRYTSRGTLWNTAGTAAEKRTFVHGLHITRRSIRGDLAAGSTTRIPVPSQHSSFRRDAAYVLSFECRKAEWRVKSA